MNIFSSAKSALVLGVSRVSAAVAAVLRSKPEGTAAPVAREPNQNFTHLIRYRESRGRPVFGPAFDAPREDHHLSRETCRHYLRVRMFASVSAGNLLMPRRERRKFASLFARLEYRRQMQDETNVLSEAEALTYVRPQGLTEYQKAKQDERRAAMRVGRVLAWPVTSRYKAGAA